MAGGGEPGIVSITMPPDSHELHGGGAHSDLLLPLQMRAAIRQQPVEATVIIISAAKIISLFMDFLRQGISKP